MRTRIVSLIALLALPAALSAQVIRSPRRPSVPAPAPLPPTGGPVAATLELHRSRWSTEAYSLLSNVRVPAGPGAVNYGSFGAGTHAGYRFADRFTGSIDLTSTMFGSPINSSTAEIGTRFMPTPFDGEIRPFFDVRAAYLYLSDNFSMPGQQQFGAFQSQVARYGNGFGAIAGGGFEYSLAPSFALSTELTAVRGRMTAYRIDNPTSIPVGSSYWMTTYRLSFGLKYAATRTSRMIQKAR